MIRRGGLENGRNDSGNLRYLIEKYAPTVPFGTARKYSRSLKSQMFDSDQKKLYRKMRYLLFL
jgi:hemolysin-activating ACP:hemolysin acyltransferase